MGLTGYVLTQNRKHEIRNEKQLKTSQKIGRNIKKNRTDDQKNAMPKLK